VCLLLGVQRAIYNGPDLSISRQEDTSTSALDTWDGLRLPLQPGQADVSIPPPTPSVTFLELPTEMRNMICELVFERDSVFPRVYLSRFFQPAITRTCRQIRRETLPMLTLERIRDENWVVSISIMRPNKAKEVAGLARGLLWLFCGF
jgi:hypothetical protein